MSHPTWVRGLKPATIRDANANPESHPTWVRGLKQDDYDQLRLFESRTLRGCVD